MDRIDILRKGYRKWFSSLTDDMKLAISEKHKNCWANRSDEERVRLFELLKSNSISYWRNISSERFNDWDLKSAIGRASANTKPTITETEFMNRLAIDCNMKPNKDYKFQYTSKLIHPEFSKLFPINPISDNNRVSPYHVWDIIIYKESGNILVDIDGSHHSIPPGIWIDSKTGIDVGLYHQFKDGQRFYQTDGLDAYVVKCYDDNLNNDTEVISLHSGETLLLVDLLELLR